MQGQECSNQRADSALWVGSVIELLCPYVCASVTLRHLSPVTCHMSPITCIVSHGFFCNIFVSYCKKYIVKTNILFLFHFYYLTRWWSYLVKGLLSTGPNPSSFLNNQVLCQHGLISWLSMYQRLIEPIPFFYV